MTNDIRISLLTPAQERFATNLAAGMTQAAAYRQAFPQSKHWKDETIYPKASSLAAQGKVQARIAELGQKAAAANEVTIERVVAELAKVAFANQRQVMQWGRGGVKLRESADLSEDEAAIVSEVSETMTATGGTLKLKTHDKVRALELLGKHLGIFIDRTELTGKNGGPIEQKQTGGVLLVPGVMDPEAWAAMAEKQGQA